MMYYLLLDLALKIYFNYAFDHISTHTTNESTLARKLHFTIPQWSCWLPKYTK